MLWNEKKKPYTQTPDANINLSNTYPLDPVDASGTRVSVAKYSNQIFAHFKGPAPIPSKLVSGS